METTYYQLLEIKTTSTDEEIKRAYFKIIKQYPVDQYPEEFKAIRIAYDTLRNAQTRKEYDMKMIHGDLVEQLQKEAMDAYSVDDFEKAKRLFKEVLSIVPMQTEIRNYYALSFLFSEEYNQALQQFRIVVQEEPENVTYQLNYGNALENSGREDEAIRHYKKMYIMWPDEMNPLFALVDLYLNRDEDDKALKTLDQAISSQEKTESFHVFYYLAKRIKVSVLLRNQIELTKSIKLCKNLLDKHESERGKMLSDLTDLALDLYDRKLYGYAKPILEFIQKERIEPNEKFDSLVEETNNRANVYDEFEMLERDEKVMKWVKNIFILYLHGNDFTEEEFNEYSNTAYNNLHDSSFYNPKETLKSIKRVLIKYPHLYETREKALADFMATCKEAIQCEEEFERLKDDYDVCHPIKRLIAYYLIYFDSDEEKKEMFESIKADMIDESDRSLRRSVNRLEMQYPSLFNLNESFFRDLQ
ncbi:J domain-containing protein [Bacillus sinesaloumensis]|uniref:J domain-containing protein n=1 Tax=Litchfieldia sinesaloumensis TaxID=1926280 RepID=UPI001151BBAD|nr:DnaJ domain-containing protein [Bacillus sinesaloumensis]